ncbi:hypothetical protein N802_03650 [Knoellia sinensis KCTC 19936]|uniref:Tripartite ATP-independent periplasmic transporters DctQ component domain-containing protein n=1 Tax=Knoellia sinensis KCTC 19936 TaxID=1385520 RepID=A0A0A0J797_9MICO|nr:TRAP transporter small permease [Knoellia sinensis]KGN31471.1 hypothetical protein N802_03650 [Knoellia sinensis KCTC 19936]
MDSNDASPPDTARGGALTTLAAILNAPRRVIDKILAVLCVVIFTALVLIVGWQVFSRQVLPTPATWTEESARYVFVVLAMLGSALVFSERGHIAVELLAERLPGVAQKVLAVVVELTVVFFAAFVLIYGGMRAASNAWGQNIPTMPVSVGQIYAVLPVAGVLIAYFAICHLVSVLAGTEAAVPELDESAQGI